MKDIPLAMLAASAGLGVLLAAALVGVMSGWPTRGEPATNDDSSPQEGAGAGGKGTCIAVDAPSERPAEAKRSTP